MGVVFFLTLTPLILAILALLVVIAVVGIAVIIIGITGGIVSASVLSDKRMKTVSLLFFGSILLLGMSCIAVLSGLLVETSLFIPPTLTLIGASVVTLGVVGTLKALELEGKVARVTFAILLCASSAIGALVFASGLVFLFW